MNKHICLDQIEFHDSTIVSFRVKGESVEIEFEDVGFTDKLVKVDLTIFQVIGLWIDGVSIKHSGVSLMEADAGDVSSLKMLDNTVSLLVAWFDYEGQVENQIFRSYRIRGKSISVDIGEVICNR